jgi:hypothetical protein
VVCGLLGGGGGGGGGEGEVVGWCWGAAFWCTLTGWRWDCAERIFGWA